VDAPGASGGGAGSGHGREDTQPPAGREPSAGSVLRVAPDGTGTRTDDALSLHVDATDGHLDLCLDGPLDRDDDALVAEGSRLVARAACGAGGRTVRLVADHPADHLLPIPERVAERLGLDEVREVVQLRVALPIPGDHPVRATAPTIAGRPFDPTVDVDRWVATNNRAFAWHPDQADRTAEQLRRQLAEPWVDLAGFVVLDDPDRPDRLAGSCWTRVHQPTDTEPALGEIFVIVVDPSLHGRGLGAALVLAGLDHLAERGLAIGMLYVEADNGAARHLYERLGFVVHQRRRIRS